MKHSGLLKIKPDRRDHHIVKHLERTYGALDPLSLPEKFSIYDGRSIPNQDEPDTRFDPPLPPLPFACTAETTTFLCGLEDGKLYNPEWLYRNTPPFDNGGRDIRDALNTAAKLGLMDDKGNIGGQDWDSYGHVYASGKIDDYDAARFSCYLLSRGVSIGTWWYGIFTLASNGLLSAPSFNTNEASLHNWLVTGWDKEGIELIPWIGGQWDVKGLGYLSRGVYNALLNQPYTGAFSFYKLGDQKPITLGVQAYIDHLINYIRTLFNV